jgi:hypothetical protein
VNGELSPHWKPTLSSYPVFIGVFCLIFALWIGNWLFHCSHIPLHLFLTAVFFFALIATGSSYAILLWVNQVGDWMGTPVILARVSKCIWNILLDTAILLIAIGWCVIRVSIQRTILTIGLIALILMNSSTVVIQFMDETEWWISMSGIYLVGLTCYVFIVYHSTKKTLQYVIGHLIVISRDGIDPTTTPIQAKLRTIKIFAVVVRVYYTMVMCITCVNIFAVDLQWITSILFCITEVLFEGIIAVLFRIKKIEIETYATREETETQAVVALADIEHYYLNEEEECGKLYEEGMELAPQPNVVIGNQVDENEPANPYDTVDL